MAVYSAKFSLTEKRDLKTGETTILGLDSSVNGYKDRALLDTTVQSYNSERRLPSVKRVYESKDWTVPTWNDMFEELIYMLSKKKRKRHKKY